MFRQSINDVYIYRGKVASKSLFSKMGDKGREGSKIPSLYNSSSSWSMVVKTFKCLSNKKS